MAFIKRRYLFEADDDNNGGGNTNGADQNAAQGNDAQQNAQGSDDAQENNAQDDTSNDDTNNNDQDQDTDNQDDQNAEENNEEDDDYSIDADPDEDNGDEDNSDDSSSDDDSGNDEDSESEEDSEDKQMDRDMFSTLSEDEQKRKIATLKRLYIELYTNIDSIIEKFGLIDNGDEDENFLPIIKRIMNILYDMKAYISDYILTIFDKVSYIENDVTFNRYLSVLDGIKLICNELEKQKESEDKSKK